MGVTRRELMVLAGAAAIAGCGQQGNRGRSTAARGPVDAGPLSDIARNGIDGRFADSHGFFVVRRGARVFASSADCTHRDCPLAAEANAFYCSCHGSRFSLDGNVTRGPARRTLPRFAVEKSPSGHLIVHPERRLEPAQFEQREAYVVVE